MRNSIIITTSIFALLCSCTSVNKTPSPTDTVVRQPVVKIDSSKNFDQKVYLKIDRISSGPVYEDKNHANVFYRILEVPEEENISLYAEKISIGDEGGNYQLLNRIRLSDNNSILPKFGLAQVDSLIFTDSVTVTGYFNAKKQSLNLSELK